jgi:hypothetical protein
MTTTPFEASNLPPLGNAVAIALDAEKPTGEKFSKGETAVICEHSLSADGLYYVGARTADGRILRAAFTEAFEAPRD